jgi:hypothetical protein
MNAKALGRPAPKCIEPCNCNNYSLCGAKPCSNDEGCGSCCDGKIEHYRKSLLELAEELETLKYIFRENEKIGKFANMLAKQARISAGEKVK